MREEFGFYKAGLGKVFIYKILATIPVAKECARYESAKILASKLIKRGSDIQGDIYEWTLLNNIIAHKRQYTFRVKPYDITEIQKKELHLHIPEILAQGNEAGITNEQGDKVWNQVISQAIKGNIGDIDENITRKEVKMYDDYDDTTEDVSGEDIIVTKIKYVHKKVSDGDVFYYCYIGSETHDKPTFLLWVSSKLIKQRKREGKIEEYIQFPVKDAGIIVTEKGTKILKPDYGKVVFYLMPPAGYRGDSEISILTDVINEFDFRYFHSQRGNLGISKGKIATVDKKNLPIKFRWERSGRLYGKPSKGITIVNADGESETFESLEDELEDMKKLLD